MQDDPDLDKAYSLHSPEDNRKLYADWADTYDQSFAEDMDYALPRLVAERFVQVGGAGPVLDLGAGTGLCAEALLAHQIAPVDALDLSAEMLAVAQNKGIYTNLLTGNLLETLPIADGAYGGAVSSGTFTHGHVGAEALDEVVRVVQPGGWVCLSVNAEHWLAQGFEAKVDALGDKINDLSLHDVHIYGRGSKGSHATDLARIVAFRRSA